MKKYKNDTIQQNGIAKLTQPLHHDRDDVKMESLTQKRHHTYRVLAKDQKGNASSSSAIDVQPIKVFIDTIVGFRAQTSVSGSEKQAKLSWEYAMDGAKVVEFQIYRGTPAVPPHLYHVEKVDPTALVTDPSTGRAVFVHKDQDIVSGQEYHYRALAKFADGTSSPLSRKVVFQY